MTRAARPESVAATFPFGFVTTKPRCASRPIRSGSIFAQPLTTAASAVKSPLRNLRVAHFRIANARSPNHSRFRWR